MALTVVFCFGVNAAFPVKRKLLRLCLGDDKIFPFRVSCSPNAAQKTTDW